MKNLLTLLLIFCFSTSVVFGQSGLNNAISNQSTDVSKPLKNEFLLSIGSFKLSNESGDYNDMIGGYAYSFGFKHAFNSNFSMSLNNDYGFFEYDLVNNIPSANVSLSNVNLMTHFKVMNVKDIQIEAGAGIAYTRLTDQFYKIYFREFVIPNTQQRTYESFTAKINSIDENIALPLQLQLIKKFSKCNISIGYKYNFIPEQFWSYNLGSSFFFGLSIPL
jgi:hypothetical protein